MRDVIRRAEMLLRRQRCYTLAMPLIAAAMIQIDYADTDFAAAAGALLFDFHIFLRFHFAIYLHFDFSRCSPFPIAF